MVNALIQPGAAAAHSRNIFRTPTFSNRGRFCHRADVTAGMSSLASSTVAEPLPLHRRPVLRLSSCITGRLPLHCRPVVRLSSCIRGRSSPSFLSSSSFSSSSSSSSSTSFSSPSSSSPSSWNRHRSAFRSSSVSTIRSDRTETSSAPSVRSVALPRLSCSGKRILPLGGNWCLSASSSKGSFLDRRRPRGGLSDEGGVVRRSSPNGTSGPDKRGFLPSLPRRFLLQGAFRNMLGIGIGVVLLGNALVPRPRMAFARSNTSNVDQLLKDIEWPEQFPFRPEDFQRYDETADTDFYAFPRFVTHIDDAAIKALSKYYASVFPPTNTPGVAILDLCSSWISHYPAGYKQERIAGVGLNDEELRRNPVLTEYIVQDLNKDPKLPYEDNSFDVITNAVSVDYLVKPLEIFLEMRRVLKPGGLCIMSFSNRCFFTKAISIWTSTGDADHIWIVGAYFHYAGGFEPPQALDISPNPGRTDPMYVVFSRKLRA